MKRPRRGGRGWHRAAEEIREKLGRFAGRPRFNQEFEEAFEFYFGETVEALQETLDEADFDRFMEWFVHDYRLNNGHRLIEVFDLEHGADLTPAARRLLRAWQQTYLTLLEVQKSKSDHFVLFDLLTGAEFEVAESAFEEEVVPWTLVIGRPMPIGKGWDLSPGYTLLPPAAKEPLVRLLRAEYRRYRKVHGSTAGVARFLSEQGYVFNDFLIEIDGAAFNGQISGDELYRVVRALAVFHMRDPEKVESRLAACSGMQKIRPGRFIWYEEAKGARAGDASKESQASQSGVGNILAEVTLVGSRLQLHCWSMQRLERAKQQLVSGLGALVQHLIDAYGEPRSKEGRNWAASMEKIRIGAHAPSSAAVKAAYNDYFQNWLEQPLAALHGRSPKNLLKKELGRAKVVDLLKQLEYEQRKRRSGKGACVAQSLKRTLNLEDVPGIIIPLDSHPNLWNSEAEARVADELKSVLHQDGYSPEHVESALWLWWDYCLKAQPRIGKVSAWAAAVHSCLAFVENWDIPHVVTADIYQVSPKTVGINSNKIKERLALQPYDDRYCIEHPVDGLLERLGRIHQEMSDEQEDALGRSLAIAHMLHEEVQRIAAKYDGLHDRAQGFFISYVGCSPWDPQWREGFLDWYHYDWAVPVMGGKTLAAAAFDEAELGEANRRILGSWLGRHPSYYIVEGVGTDNLLVNDENPKLTLRDMFNDTLISVDWIRLDESVRPDDIVFGRFVPVGDMMLSLGQVFVFPSHLKGEITQAIEEERGIVDQWNGRCLSWEEFRARYAERLYAVAHYAKEGRDWD